MASEQGRTSSLSISTTINDTSSTSATTLRYERIQLLKKRKQMLQQQLDEQASRKSKNFLSPESVEQFLLPENSRQTALKVPIDINSPYQFFAGNKHASHVTVSSPVLNAPTSKSSVFTSVIPINGSVNTNNSSSDSVKLTPINNSVASFKINTTTVNPNPQNNSLQTNNIKKIFEKIDSRLLKEPPKKVENNQISNGLPLTNLPQIVTINLTGCNTFNNSQPPPLQVIPEVKKLIEEQVTQQPRIPVQVYNSVQQTTNQLPSNNFCKTEQTTSNLPTCSITTLTSGNAFTKTMTSMSTPIKSPKLVYGQLGVLRGSTQPVLFLQSPVTSTPNQVVTGISKPSQNSVNINTSTNITPNQVIRLFPVTIPSNQTATSTSINTSDALRQVVLNAIKNSKITTSITNSSVNTKGNPIILSLNVKTLTSNIDSVNTISATTLKQINFSPTINKIPKPSTVTPLPNLSNHIPTVKGNAKNGTTIVNYKLPTSSCSTNIVKVSPLELKVQNKTTPPFTAGSYIIKSGKLSGTMTKTGPPSTLNLKIIGSQVISSSKIVNGNRVSCASNVNCNKTQQIQQSTPQATEQQVFNSKSFQVVHSPLQVVHSPPKSVKALFPISMSGCARTNGIKPYQRIDTILCESSTNIIRPKSNEDMQLPIIADYKSLAKTNTTTSCENTSVISSTSLISDVVTVTSPVSAINSPRFSVDVEAHLSTRNVTEALGALQTPIISNVYSISGESTRKTQSHDVIDLTDDTVDKENVRKDNNVIEHVNFKDMVGIIRTDVKVNTKIKSPLALSKEKSTISLQCNSSVSQSVTATLTQPARQAKPVSHSDKDVLKLNQYAKISYNSTATSNLPTTKHIKAKTKRKRPTSLKVLNQTTTKFDNMSPDAEYSAAPTALEKISRTFFAMDRLCKNRRHLNDTLTLQKCMESLYALRNLLVSERNKQSHYMDDNLKNWHDAAQRAAKIPKINITPAQKLLQKFSLQSSNDTPTTNRVESSSSLPSDVKNTFNTHSDTLLRLNENKKDLSSVTPREKPKSFNEILEEQRKKKTMKRKMNQLIEGQAANRIQMSPPSVSLVNSLNPVISPSKIISPKYKHTYKTETKALPVLYDSINKKEKKTSLAKKKQSPTKQLNTAESKALTKHRFLTTSLYPVLKTEKYTNSSMNEAVHSSRIRSRKYNPKDPFNSAEDRALQSALALSLKTANAERRKHQGIDSTTNVLRKRRLDVQITDNDNSTAKKKRPSEIDQLVDTHWNESWLKEEIVTDDLPDAVSPRSSIREERALHYAIARFAEMEYKKERVKSPPLDNFSQHTLNNIKEEVLDENDKAEKFGDERILKVSNTVAVSTKYNRKIVKRKLASSSTKKKKDLIEKAKKHFSKGKVGREKNTIRNYVPAIKHDTFNTQKKKSPQSQSGTIHKKEYLLVPKYNGFKDFTPIVVDSRTRRQTTSVDREKLKKHEFPLVVVEKIGNFTKEVVVKEGEDKQQKLAEVSNLLQKEFESLSKSKRYLSYSRSTGETVLHKAARLGYADLAEISIKKGADVHARDNAGWSALHEACAYGKTNVVKVLLKYGADPNCSSNSGIRPLHDAIEKVALPCIRLLIAYGADVRIASYTGALPTDMARNPIIKKFLQDYTKDQGTSRPDADKGNFWQFQGSCEALDSNDCSGIFDDLPKDEISQHFDFLFSNKDIPQSYYLPFKNEDDIVLGYRNYFILNEILERLNISRNAFLKHHKVDLQKLSLEEFTEHVRQNTLNHLPEDIGCGSSKSDGIEMVAIGHYALKKMLSMRTYKVHR